MFDAIVIGSGLGGLTAAALLAKAGRKVCVLERNHTIGGAASAFKSGALRIEPSLHQTADPHDPNDPKHAILKELGVLDEIEWTRVSPFHSVRGEQVGGLFDLPVGFDAARAALEMRFPESRDGVARLFASVQLMQAGVTHLEQAQSEPLAARACARRHRAPWGGADYAGMRRCLLLTRRGAFMPQPITWGNEPGR